MNPKVICSNIFLVFYNKDFPINRFVCLVSNVFLLIILLFFFKIFETL